MKFLQTHFSLCATTLHTMTSFRLFFSLFLNSKLFSLHHTIFLIFLSHSSHLLDFSHLFSITLAVCLSPAFLLLFHLFCLFTFSLIFSLYPTFLSPYFTILIFNLLCYNSYFLPLLSFTSITYYYYTFPPPVHFLIHYPSFLLKISLVLLIWFLHAYKYSLPYAPCSIFLHYYCFLTQLHIHPFSLIHLNLYHNLCFLVL